MVQSSALDVRQHASDGLRVASFDVIGGAQVALTLGRLLGQGVRLEGVAGLEPAGSGLAKTLRRRPVGLDLAHGMLRTAFADGSGDTRGAALCALPRSIHDPSRWVEPAIVRGSGAVCQWCGAAGSR